MLGDIGINWAGNNTKELKIYKESLNTYRFVQTVYEPARGQAILDHIITSDTDLQEVCTTEAMFNTDHQLLEAPIVRHLNTKSKIMVRKWTLSNNAAGKIKISFKEKAGAANLIKSITSQLNRIKNTYLVE